MSKITLIVAAVIVAVAGFLGYQAIVPQEQGLGSAPQGLPSTVATSSLVTITAGGTADLFAPNFACASRVVTTKGQAIYLSFDEGGFASSTGGVDNTGHFHATDTTAVYDSGIYGCGLMTGHADAETTVTLTETF